MAGSDRHPQEKMQIVDLNPYLSCILCGGYFIDATTITECLHSFCRACIVRYLETSKYCPVCEVQIHKTRPLRCIRTDKTLQDIVYKLIPGLFQNEMKKRRELYASQPPEAIKCSRDAEDRGETSEDRYIYTADEVFCLILQHASSSQPDDEKKCKEEKEETENCNLRRYLRCPAALKVSHIKKFIRCKYSVPTRFVISLEYSSEVLKNDYSLMDVAYIYDWKRNGPLQLAFRVSERPKVQPPKKTLKRSFEETEREMQVETEPKDDINMESCNDVPSTESSDAIPSTESSDAVLSTESSNAVPSTESSNAVPSTESSNAVPSTESSDAVLSTESKTEVQVQNDKIDPSYTQVTNSCGIPDSSAANSEDEAKTSEESIKMTTPDPEEVKVSATLVDQSEPKIDDDIKCPANPPVNVPKINVTPPEKDTVNEIHENGETTKSTSSATPVDAINDDEKSPSALKVPKLTIPLTPKILQQAAQHAKEDKIELDCDLYEGRLIIAEPDASAGEEESKESFVSDIDVVKVKETKVVPVYDDEVDSGRGSESSSRADDLASPGSSTVYSPENEKPSLFPVFPDTLPSIISNASRISRGKPISNNPKPKNSAQSPCTPKDDFGVLDLSMCHRKRTYDGMPMSRPKQVANPVPVYEKHRQPPSIISVPKHPSFKLLPVVLPHNSIYKKPDCNTKGNFRYNRGSTLTVYNPDPNSGRTKIVIKNLDPKPEHRHHHYNHHHHRTQGGLDSSR